MKKSVIYISAITLLVLGACSEKDEYGGDVPSEEYWGITVPYHDVSGTETYNLLDKLIGYLDKTQARTIYFPSSNLNYPSVTKFNEHLAKSEEAVAFFKRDDCIFVLISTYLSNLETERHSFGNGYWELYNERFSFLELVLASDMSMNKMNITEKVQSMALALERARYEEYSYHYPFNIMISVMLSSNYTPFVNDIKPMLRELGMGVGYDLLKDQKALFVNTTEYSDLITGYAKQFINDNKQ